MHSWSGLDPTRPGQVRPAPWKDADEAQGTPCGDVPCAAPEEPLAIPQIAKGSLSVSGEQNV